MQVLYLGIVLRTKETLPDFLKWCRVTRHPLVFRGLTVVNGPPGLGRHSFKRQGIGRGRFSGLSVDGIV